MIDNEDECYVIAILLHYCFLVSSFWILIFSISTCLSLSCYDNVSLRILCTLAWMIPAIWVFISYILNPQSYESNRYCWISIKKGMIFSFVGPISLILLVSLAYYLLVNDFLSKFSNSGFLFHCY